MTGQPAAVAGADWPVSAYAVAFTGVDLRLASRRAAVGRPGLAATLEAVAAFVALALMATTLVTTGLVALVALTDLAACLATMRRGARRSAATSAKPPRCATP